MSDKLETAIEAMRAKHLALRPKLVSDIDTQTGYPGSGEIIADEVLAYTEKMSRERYGNL